MPDNLKCMYPELLFTDTQMNSVTKGYLADESFGCEPNGDISLWKLYNLLTAANKSSYIDLFLDRADNASRFVGSLATALEHRSSHWYLR